MEPNTEPTLKHISSKRLLDPRSDTVYAPFRDLTRRVFSQKYLIPQSQYNQLSKLSDQSLLPVNVQALEVARQTVSPLKKFRKVAQRQKQYQPVKEEVVRRIVSQSRGPQNVVYKYAEIQEDRDRLRNVPITKVEQNRAHLSDKFEQKLQIVSKRNQTQQSYNLFSFLDEPLHHIRKKL